MGRSTAFVGVLVSLFAGCASPQNPPPQTDSDGADGSGLGSPDTLDPEVAPISELGWEADDCASADALDHVLRLNHVQALGTHNSYHLEPAVPLSPEHRYSQPALGSQLRDHGVRQFELDLHLSEDGGFEVFHLPVVDAQTTCQTLVACLGILETWSDAHPGHIPLLVWLEPKDELDLAGLGYESIEGHYDALEAEILSVWPQDRVFTPDELRADHPTLPEAISAEGWPLLTEVRGKVLFALLDSGDHREAYTASAPALEGKLLFVDASSPGDAYAALFKMNNAQADAEEVTARVAAGFLVTSNVDGVDTGDEDNAARLAASLEAGCHHLSTDFPVAKDDGSYYAQIPGGTPAGCNPIVAPPGCEPEHIEDLP